ncbi:hypothetical protein DF22_002146 [Xylella fastidiosa]|nr:hypothetical protein DF22_002146 [Xylella fastidiosa]
MRDWPDQRIFRYWQQRHPDHVRHILWPLPLRLLLGLRQGTAIKLTHRLTEIHVEVTHHKANRIMMRATPKAMHKPFMRNHRERGGVLVMERT